MRIAIYFLAYLSRLSCIEGKCPTHDTWEMWSIIPFLLMLRTQRHGIPTIFNCYRCFSVINNSMMLLTSDFDGSVIHCVLEIICLAWYKNSFTLSITSMLAFSRNVWIDNKFICTAIYHQKCWIKIEVVNDADIHVGVRVSKPHLCRISENYAISSAID